MEIIKSDHNFAAVWIDHKKAVISFLDDKGHREQVLTIESNVSAHINFKTGRGYSSNQHLQMVKPAISQERKHQSQLKRYFQEIIQTLKGIGSFIVIGPGEAKIEFQKEIHKNKELFPLLKEVLPQDNITETQLVAYAKKFHVPVGSPFTVSKPKLIRR
ncbi:MAG: hypothetical protein A2Y40_08375 [Candidatus Margulisbacteria bacterium GWF2_35_9]|nr:MAG: hypothetical protein A2Y40_08375 [Candidatus Margulisbacteria bacterium GWF2_35_9]